MAVKQRTKSIINGQRARGRKIRREFLFRRTKCRHITNSPVFTYAGWGNVEPTEIRVVSHPCDVNGVDTKIITKTRLRNNTTQICRRVAVNPNSSSKAPPAKRRNHHRMNMCVRCSDLFSIHIRDHIIYKKTRQRLQSENL